MKTIRHRLSLLCLCLVTVGCPDNPTTVPVPEIGSGADVRVRDVGGEDLERSPALPGDLLAAADGHSCAIVEGQLWCWGSRYRPEGTEQVDTPTPVPGPPPVEVDAELYTTCVRFETDAVRCWRPGLRDGGRVDLNPGGKVVRLGAGGLFGCALLGDGTVECWGQYPDDVLGRGGETDVAPPAQPRPVVGVDDAIDLAVGVSHACAVSGDGQVRCWGQNHEGQLGLETDGEGVATARLNGVRDAAKIAAGGHGTCVVHRDGRVSCWGTASFGALFPVPENHPERVRDIDVNGERACVIDESGDLFCWRGSQPGVRVDSLENVAEVSVGVDHTCVRLEAGQVLCWGENAKGQVGQKVPLDSEVAVDVLGLDEVEQVRAGSDFTCARLEGGDVRCWGGLDGASGRPARVRGLDEVTQIAAHSDSHRACALDVLQRVACWSGGLDATPLDAVPGDGVPSDIAVGWEDFCAVYDGGFVTRWGDARIRPQQVLGIDDATAVWCGTGFICVRHEDGGYSCWGKNDEGQVGVGTGFHEIEGPTRVEELDGASGLALGTDQACAVVDRRLLCWGDGYASIPVDIDGFDEVIDVGAGGRRSTPFYGPSTTARTCVVDGGSVWCWEDRRPGSESRRIEGVTDALRVTVGAGHACALRAGGRVVCWGDNDVGQLGDGSVTYQSAPAPVGLP